MAKSQVIQEMISESRAYRSPYERWKESEGLPTIRGYFIKSLLDLELTPWKSSGEGKAVFINMEGAGSFNDAYVCEIPPQKALTPHRHLFEERTYVLRGRGATSVWLDGGGKHTFEWQEGSYFAVPMNAWHQHFNASGSEPARFVAVTTAPTVMNTFDSSEFVFDNPFVFRDRFTAEEDYFTQTENTGKERAWLTNFIANVKDCKLRESIRGPGRAMVFAMVKGKVKSHTQLWPVGIYTTGHRHGPGIHVLILEGRGYTLLWQEGTPVQRIDWGPGSMFVPPEMWFHQHFNAGSIPVRMLAIGWGTDKPKSDGKGYVYTSVKEGGDQIDFEDEDPKIHQEFEAAMAREGVACRMGAVHPLCTQKPTSTAG